MRARKWFGISMLALSLVSFGCSRGVFTSAIRTNFSGDVEIESACEEFADEHFEGLNDALSRYSEAGWRLYLYTQYDTPNTFYKVGLACFERIKGTGKEVRPPKKR